MVALEKGRTEEARATLREVRTQVEKWEAEPFRITTADNLLWSNWGIARILLREAETMLAKAES
jgi:hypothetical protein